MGTVIDFPPVCRSCHAKKSIINRLTTDPLGNVITLDICERCGTLQAEPKVVTQSV
jgi:hypothetical protein